MTKPQIKLVFQLWRPSNRKTYRNLLQWCYVRLCPPRIKENFKTKAAVGEQLYITREEAHVYYVSYVSGMFHFSAFHWTIIDYSGSYFRCVFGKNKHVTSLLIAIKTCCKCYTSCPSPRYNYRQKLISPWSYSLLLYITIFYYATVI